ncbi:hypothetical protein BC834DRAFT_51749 [Gloeopeniophorella convolvens]|nr:hypothetical protein BC834DRAFT_51749 [Gloeopeniophorella convolvens]
MPRSCMPFLSVLSVLCALLHSLACLLLSLLLRTPIRSHRLRVARLSLSIRHPFITLHDVSATFPAVSIYPSTSITFSILTCTPSAFPARIICVLINAQLKSPLSIVSTTRLNVLIYAHPPPATAPIHATLNGFRLRVFTSSRTPYHVGRLRSALLRSLLCGEVLRCNHFHTKLSFEDEDDICVRALARCLVFHDRKGRVYAFDRVRGVLKRTWPYADEQGRGMLEIEATNGRWLRLPPAGVPAPPIWRGLWDPMAQVELTVPQAHIMFDDFRIRDGNLLGEALRAFSSTVKPDKDILDAALGGY